MSCFLSPPSTQPLDPLLIHPPHIRPDSRQTYFKEMQFQNLVNSPTKNTSYFTSGSRIWSRGGPRNFSRDFADIAKRSRVSEASQYRLALAFLTLKYVFSHFSWYFFFKKLTSIYVGTLQNIYFNT